MCFVDSCGISVGFELCSFAIVVIDPKLNDIDFLLRLLRHGFASVCSSGNRNGDITKSGRPAASGHNSPSGRVQASPIGFALALLVFDLHGEVTVVGSAGENAHDAVIGVAIEIGHHRIVVVILRAIRRSVAEARLCLKIKEDRG